jgi:hypothetical protein
MWGGFTLYGGKSLLIGPFIPPRPSRQNGNGIDHPEFDGIQECGKDSVWLNFSHWPLFPLSPAAKTSLQLHVPSL